jgi:hypothetical protein
MLLEHAKVKADSLYAVYGSEYEDYRSKADELIPRWNTELQKRIEGKLLGDALCRQIETEMAELSQAHQRVTRSHSDYKNAIAAVDMAQEALDGPELTVLKTLANAAVSMAFDASGGESGGIDAIDACISTSIITGCVIAFVSAGYSEKGLRKADRDAYRAVIESGGTERSARSVASLVAVGAAALAVGYDPASVVQAAATPAALRGKDPAPLYMLPAIGTKESPTLHVIALAMSMLGFSTAEIASALSEARDKKVDSAQVRRITKPWCCVARPETGLVADRLAVDRLG